MWGRVFHRPVRRLTAGRLRICDKPAPIIIPVGRRRRPTIERGVGPISMIEGIKLKTVGARRAAPLLE